MTSVQHHVVTQTHSSTNHLDSHLDALLDDLQTTVSRPGTSLALYSQNGPMMNGSSFGGHINLPPGASGYREITTTVTRDTNGVPMTSREYQIEYLNPANSVTVLDDRSSSPAMDLLKSADLPGHQIQSYKTEVYDYKYSKTTSDKKMTSNAGFGGNQKAIEDGRSHSMESRSSSHYPQEKPQIQDTGAQYSRTEGSETFRSDSKVGRNLNELDLLLKELNTSPGDSRTTPRREHVHTIETRMQRDSGRYPESPSTMPKRSASATREMTYTQERTQNRMNRAASPTLTSGSSRSPGRTINVKHEYNTLESSGHTSRRDSPSTRNRSAEMSPTLRRRTPSPSSGEFRPSTFSNYPISPKDLTPTRTVTTKTYNYSTTGRRTPTPTKSFDEPQPYRSPSPVSFPQKRSPSPNRRSLNRSDSGRNVSYQVDNSAVSSYKYASHSREQSRYAISGFEESMSRPFPSSTPIPVGDQNPPKKLDDLMASFEDSRISARSPQGGQYSQGTGEYTHKIEIARESHDAGLHRSPSFERNLRPSSVKVSQTYSQQQQQQGQEYQNQYQQREQQFQQSQYQQRELQPSSYHKEYQRREEYHTSQQQQQSYPAGQFQQPPQAYPRDTLKREQYQQQQYQQQQYQQNQGGYPKESREQYQQGQYQQSQGHQYQQNQQYQYQHNQQYQQQHQQHQQQASQKSVNESMSASQGYRTSSATRSVAGPPVYYPPGVELFTKKEEAMLNQEQSGSRKKGKSKTKDKGKDKGKGVSGVPMCLPVCCAMPCSIM